MWAFKTEETIINILWSPNSEHLLVHEKDGTINVFSLTKDWECRLSEGTLSISKAMWLPDSLHILTVSKFGLRMTIWDLSNSNRVVLLNFKLPSRERELDADTVSTVAFSSNQDYIAVSYVKNHQDMVVILDCSSYLALSKFTAATKNLGGIQWVKNDVHLLLWDDTNNHRLVVQSVIGDIMIILEDDTIGTGIVDVIPNSIKSLAAVICNNYQVQILNLLTFQYVATYQQNPDDIDYTDSALRVYKEIEKDADNATYEVHEWAEAQEFQGITSEAAQTFEEKPSPGLSQQCHLSWDSSNRLLASMHNLLPHVVWVYDTFNHNVLAVLVHKRPVRGIRWIPAWTNNSKKLIIVTGASHIAEWTPNAATIIHLPHRNMKATKVNFNSDGSACCIQEKGSFCLGYPYVL